MLCGVPDIKLSLTSLTVSFPLSLSLSLSVRLSLFQFYAAATVRKVIANWLNSSSAQVWWERLILSQNVDVLEYLAYVHRNDVSSGSELSNGELIIERWRFTPESSHGLIAGLTSHAGYRVSVRAKVRDADGTVFETEESSKVGVYIPGNPMCVCVCVCSYVYCHSAKLSIYHTKNSLTTLPFEGACTWCYYTLL